jgi:hypothetical protein
VVVVSPLRCCFLEVRLLAASCITVAVGRARPVFCNAMRGDDRDEAEGDAEAVADVEVDGADTGDRSWAGIELKSRVELIKLMDLA